MYIYYEIYSTYICRWYLCLYLNSHFLFVECYGMSKGSVKIKLNWKASDGHIAYTMVYLIAISIKQLNINTANTKKYLIAPYIKQLLSVKSINYDMLYYKNELKDK